MMKLKLILLLLLLFALNFAGDCGGDDVKEVGGDGEKYGYTTESDKDDTVIYGSTEKQAKKNKKEYDKEIYPTLHEDE